MVSNSVPILSDSSIRLPGGNSTVTRISPVSSSGKNSVPNNGISAMEPNNNTTAITTTFILLPSAQSSTEPYKFSMYLNQPCFSNDDLALRNLEASIGVNVSAVSNDATMVTITITPSSLNIIPAIPLRKMSGIKTTIVVSDEALIANPTSEAPVIAALNGSAPRARWVKIFSITTIALSTTIPMAMDILASDIILMVRPQTYKNINELINENGMVSAIIKLERNSPRNSRVTIITNIPPQKMVSRRLLMVRLIISPVLNISMIFISAGRFFLIISNFS